MSQPKAIPQLIELKKKLYTKQQEFIKGLRNKMPQAELIKLNEELKKIYQEILALRSKEL